MDKIVKMKLSLLLGMALMVSQWGIASRIWIEAESFQNKGGWVVDQQFMDLMGSPYLMAHGLGEPVADADVVYYTDWKGNTETGKTNENGLLTLARKIKTNSDSNNNYSVSEVIEQIKNYT